MSDSKITFYKHQACDIAIIEDRIEDACNGCKQHIWGKLYNVV